MPQTDHQYLTFDPAQVSDEAAAQALFDARIAEIDTMCPSLQASSRIQVTRRMEEVTSDGTSVHFGLEITAPGFDTEADAIVSLALGHVPYVVEHVQAISHTPPATW